jgi:hypothetical protein
MAVAVLAKTIGAFIPRKLGATVTVHEIPASFLASTRTI